MQYIWMIYRMQGAAAKDRGAFFLNLQFYLERPIGLHICGDAPLLADPTRNAQVDGHGALARLHLPAQLNHTAAALHTGARCFAAHAVGRPRVTFEFILPS